MGCVWGLVVMNNNIMFSELGRCDLQDLILDIENFDLEYRDNLDLPLFVSFGVEIEYEGLLKSDVDSYLDQNHSKWISSVDGSLRRGGGEIISPIMFDIRNYWNPLKDICHYLKDNHADTLHNAGGHIHVGVQTLGEQYDSWFNFVTMYAVYEHVLYRFFYGDKVNARKNICKYARPMADSLYNRFSFYKETNYYKEILIDLLICFDRNCAINFGNVNYSNTGEFSKNNTIEFRIPNGSVEEVIWQNNINVITKLLLASRFRDIDLEYLNYKLNYDRVSSDRDYCLYHEVCLKDSLEFVDMVFDNTLDKYYFLRQYFKNFENNYREDKTVMAKKFVK